MKPKSMLLLTAALAAGFAVARNVLLTATVAAPLIFTLPVQAGDFDHSHAAFSAILKEAVKNERVDYAALKRNPAPLAGYLGSLAGVKESEFKGWAKEQRLAWLINLYNAATIKLVTEKYPVKSIKDIGSTFKGPWDQAVVPLFGKMVTLNHIEHELIRPQYAEPRAHFGLVCASVGCPPLRSEAFVADRLGAQLDEQGRIFLATTSKNKVDVKAGVLYLSPIFKWFTKDFTDKSGSVEKFVAPYFGEADAKAILGGNLKIKYTDYDWSLNGP